MGKKSAGILLYQFENKSLKIFLVHPGGPFWAKKDTGAWSIPKGEFTEGEEMPLDAAKREFKEETGFEVNGDFITLTPIRQKSGKLIYAWALQGDIDAEKIRSNTLAIEWPPHTGIKLEIPEVDKAAWFNVEEAKVKIMSGQLGFIDELMGKLK